MPITHKAVSTQSEFESFREAVKNAGLPIQDLNHEHQVLILYFNDNTFVGTGGLEILNRVALLRSVSISTTQRGKNLGKAITTDLLKKAENKGIEAVFLLTETAKGFFEKQGFETIDRATAPMEIKSTTEFSGVCPVSAVLMIKKLK
jgi:amino-acid N-acetyltransferase